MAVVNITLGEVSGVAASGGTMPILKGSTASSENKTSSGTSQQSALVASNNVGTVFVITVTGGNVCVKFGTNPTATNASTYILDGQTRSFSAVPGDKVALIDA